MKLEKIKIIHFGQLTDCSFDLSSPEFNVFFGENEAGKSTVVAFIKQILFGFSLGNRTTKFFEKYQPLSKLSPMGGSLFFNDEKDNHYELERLWSKGDRTKMGILTVKSNGQVVSPDVFFAQIKNISADFYADNFIFNQEMLSQIFGLNQNDLLERIYNLGTANSAKLLNLRDEFDKKAHKLFTKTGKKQEVGSLLLTLEDKRQAVKDAENEFSTYQNLENDLDDQSKQLKKLDAQLKELQKQNDEVEKLQEQLPNYEKLRTIEKEVQQVDFDEKNFAQAQELLVQEKNLKQNCQALEERLGKFPREDIDPSENKLLLQKNQFLKWQTRVNYTEQNIEQAQTEQAQILTLNPAVKKVINLNQNQLLELQKDYHALPKDSMPESSVTQEKENYSYLPGIILLIFGLACLLFKKINFGLIGLVLGIGLLGLGYFQKLQKQNKLSILTRKREVIKQAHADFVNRYGLSGDKLDISSLINDWRQFQVKQQTIKTENENLGQLNKKIANLAAQLTEALTEKVFPSEQSVLAAFTKLEERIKAKDQRRQKQEELQATLSSYQQSLKKLALQQQFVFAQAQVKDMVQYKAQRQAYFKQKELNNEIEVLKNNLPNDLSSLKDFSENKDNQVRIDKLIEQITELEREKANLQTKIAELRVKMNNLADSKSLFMVKQDLANTRAELKEASVDYLANLFAADWIKEALDLASNDRFPKMVKAAKKYFKLLTAGHYLDIQFGKNLTVIRDDGQKFKIEFLSRATAEQLYFALKLAFVGQINDQIDLPILIDDSFVNFDDARVDLIKELLLEIAKQNQVLIFTAQKNLVKNLAVEPLIFAKGK